MKQSNKRKLVSILITLIFIMGIAVAGYADDVFDFNDKQGTKEWDAAGQKEYQEAIKTQTAVTFLAAMQSLGPVVGGIAVAIARNDRETIVKLSKAFFAHPPLIPQSRKKWFPRPEDDIESKTYGLEAHYWGFRLGEHAKDPRVETNVLLWDFSQMLGRCMKCHDRFRDSELGRKIKSGN